MRSCTMKGLLTLLPYACGRSPPPPRQPFGGTLPWLARQGCSGRRPGALAFCASGPPAADVGDRPPPAAPAVNDPAFKVVGEKRAYTGWRNIIRRDIKLPTGHVSSFDIVDQEHPSVAVFAWHTRSQTATLIREFAPGRGEMSYGVVAGMFELDKHESPLQAAKFELEEEAHLMGGSWHSLLDGLGTTIAADKYSTNEFYAYLVVDPQVTPDPKPHDADEFIVVERGVPMERARQMVLKGHMSVVSSFVTLLAADKLRSLGLIPYGDATADGGGGGGGLSASLGGRE